MAKIFSPAFSKIARLRQAEIDIWRNDMVAAQRNVLQDLITAGQFTLFGIKHQLEKVRTIKDFKKYIPIQSYETHLNYIEKMMEGEQNVLWNTPIEWFAKSSGTTSQKSKFIPVSEESLKENHFKASKDVLTNYYKYFPESNLLTGKGLVIGGSHQISNYNEEVKFGDLSAVLMENSPFWGQWLRTPQLSIALLDEWENKIEQLAQATILENVTSLAGVPTWTLVLLKRILEITGKQNIKEVWPNLELYIHGGVSFEPYIKTFETLIGYPINYLEIYNASEGFFAGQEKPNDNGMLLAANHGVFFEFMPIEEYGKDAPETIGLDKVVVNKIYAPVITTTGGLWRYLIGDTIKFTDLNPFKIKVVGRLKHFINAFGEELIVDNAENALAKTCSELNCSILDYTAAPIFFSEQNNGCHQWLIEFIEAPTDMNNFTVILDKYLQETNSDYEAKRFKNIALRLPEVKLIPQGSFNKWLKINNKLGGQHKIPRLCNDRLFIDEILSLL